MKVNAHIEADRVSEEFKQARRDLNRRTRSALKTAGERVALPDARRRSSGLRVAGKSVAASLYIRPTQRTAYLASRMRGKSNRAVGLLEFGGTVKTPIRPKNAKALKIGNRFVANVTGPRHYRGQHFMSEAVGGNASRIEAAIKDEVMKAFDGLDHD